MRIYKDLPEALNEAKRDVAEMGIRVHTQTYQDKFIGDDPKFETLELQNYIYTVVHPAPFDIMEQTSQPWANAEFRERVGEFPLNPGAAWKKRPEVWTEFLGANGQFSYTYSERMLTRGHLDKVIKCLSKDKSSRQAFLSIWNPSKDPDRIGGSARVPCSLGYQFQVREGKLNMTYLQRSCDLVTHFTNDVYLATNLQAYVAEALDLEMGTFTHWIGSLHMFRKDAKGIF